MKREKESCGSCRDGCDQKPFRPIVETFTSKHSKHDDEAGENCNQANQRVNYGVDLQYHSFRLHPFPRSMSRHVYFRVVNYTQASLQGRSTVQDELSGRRPDPRMNYKPAARNTT